MEQPPQDLIVRHPALEDAQATLDLIIARDISDYGEPDSSIEDLLDQWSGIDLDQDAWLVFTPDNQLVGYAAVFGGTLYSFDFFTHPMLNRIELNSYLLRLCVARAQEQLAGTPELGRATARTILSHVNLVDRQAVEGVGFSPHIYHFRMQIELNSPPPDPVWPVGVTLRTDIPGQDDRLVFDFIQAAFDRPGRIPQSFERWRAFMMRPDHFNPELWYLAYHQDELVGAILCFDYPQFGWVRQLGVAAHWRRHGLGAALLQHMFGLFYRRGHTRVALGVESDNLNAYRFYEKLGMQCVRQYDEYHMELVARRK